MHVAFVCQNVYFGRAEIAIYTKIVFWGILNVHIGGAIFCTINWDVAVRKER